MYKQVLCNTKYLKNYCTNDFGSNGPTYETAVQKLLPLLG
jgi:hypothetical protein